MESLEEIKLRLVSKDPEQRIDALLDAWKHGTEEISNYSWIVARLKLE